MHIYLVTARDENFQSGWLATGNASVSSLGHAMKIYLALSGKSQSEKHAGGIPHMATSMKTYLATWPPDKQREQTEGQVIAAARGQSRRDPLRLRVLLSYYYYRDTDLDALFAKYFTEPYPEVFADSGAFSAMTQGVNINIHEYAAWVKRWQHRLSVYANLDVIKNADATWRNQQILEDRHGLAPLPTFHVLEDWRWLVYYVERYPYIGLGVAGMQGRKEAVMRWLVKCFKIAGDKAVFHGFGLTSWGVMSSFPWYSVDSSSWGAGFRYGRVPVFDTVRGRFQQLQLGDLKAWHKHRRLVRALGFDPLDFADRARNDRAKICALSALSYMLAERWLRARHGDIPIPDRAGEPGLRVHLADGSITNLGDADAGVKLHLVDSNATNLGDADAGLKLYLVDSTHDLIDARSAAAKGVPHD